MKNPTVTTSQLCIGIDLGDQYCQVCILDRETGEVVEESRLQTKQDAFQRRFGSHEACRIALEVGTHSPWISRLLEEAGHQVIVANPHRLRLIYKNDSKSDKVDAEYLARLASADPKLLHPIQHRREDTQVHRALITMRDRAVACRTKIVNSIRGLSKSLGTPLPKCDASAFHNKCRSSLPSELESICTPMMEQLASLSQTIRQYEKEIARLCEEHYPETARLQQVHGVGPITSLAYILTIEDPSRFKKSRSVGAYFGLRPAKRSSGRQDPELAITKAGDKRMRRLLIQCAHRILEKRGEDCDLKRWGLKLAARGGKSAKKRATAAVARKLSVLLHRLWITAEPYDPFWNSGKAKRATG
jgi:transposase